MANDVKDVRSALARAVAEYRVTDEVVDEVAEQIARVNYPIRGISVCERGICIDYFVEGGDWRAMLPDVADIPGGRLWGIDVFPWGIINPDLLHVRVTQEFDAMLQARR